VPSNHRSIHQQFSHRSEPTAWILSRLWLINFQARGGAGNSPESRRLAASTARPVHWARHSCHGRTCPKDKYSAKREAEHPSPAQASSARIARPPDRGRPLRAEISRNRSASKRLLHQTAGTVHVPEQNGDTVEMSSWLSQRTNPARDFYRTPDFPRAPRKQMWIGRRGGRLLRRETGQ